MCANSVMAVLLSSALFCSFLFGATRTDIGRVRFPASRCHRQCFKYYSGCRSQFKRKLLPAFYRVTFSGQAYSQNIDIYTKKLPAVLLDSNAFWNAEKRTQFDVLNLKFTAV